MQTIKTELSINGKKVVIGYQFLEDIVSDILVKSPSIEIQHIGVYE